MCVCGGKREGFKYLLVLNAGVYFCLMNVVFCLHKMAAFLPLWHLFFSECPVVARWYGKDFLEIKTTYFFTTFCRRGLFKRDSL